MRRLALHPLIIAALFWLYAPLPAAAVPNWNGQMNQDEREHNDESAGNAAAEQELENRESDRDALTTAERDARQARAEAQRKWAEAQQAAQRAATNTDPRKQAELDEAAREAREAAEEAQREANRKTQYAEDLLDEVKRQFSAAEEEAERAKEEAARTAGEHAARAKDSFVAGQDTVMNIAKAMVLATMLEAMGMRKQARTLNKMVAEGIAIVGPVGAALYGAALIEVIEDMKDMLRIAAKTADFESDEARQRAVALANTAAENSERGAAALLEMMRELQRLSRPAL